LGNLVFKYPDMHFWLEPRRFVPVHSKVNS
jgi:hypothetical protein